MFDFFKQVKTESVCEMNTYLITFEIQDRNKISQLDEMIQQFPTWARITSTCYAVVTEESARSIRDRISSILSADDRLFICLSGRVAAWKNSRCSNDWLRGNL